MLLLPTKPPPIAYKAQPTARPVHIPAPVGGWNSRDELDNMKPSDAVRLDNMFPDTGSVNLREGYSQHATGCGGSVETLASLNKTGSTLRLIAGANGNLWNVTSSGSASSIGSGYSSNRWHTANMNGLLHLVNGSDGPLNYDGTTLSTTSFSGPSSPEEFIGIHVFKNRMFLWKDNTLSFYFGGNQAVSGSLSEFPLAYLGSLGGKIIGMGTWAVDAGDGMDDLLVIGLSSGQVLAYAGTNPGDATAWALKGIFNMGAPLDKRAFLKYGSELIVPTTDDFKMFSRVMQYGNVVRYDNESLRKISGAARDAAKSYSGNFGWAAVHYAKGTRVLVNVPLSASKFHQYVMNTLTGAWCRFTGMNGPSWVEHNGDVYFGGTDGKVYKAFDGLDDNGANIATVDVQTAWNRFNSPLKKQITALRFFIASSGPVTFEFALPEDFGSRGVTATSQTASSGSQWDSATWDVSLWAGAPQANRAWQAAGANGHAIATRLRLSTKNQTAFNWYSTEYLVQQGLEL